MNRFVDNLANEEPSGFLAGIIHVGPPPSFLMSHSTFFPAWAKAPTASSADLCPPTTVTCLISGARTSCWR